MQDRICLITGANTGIGKVTALELVRRGAHVVMACRNVDKAQAAADEIASQTRRTKPDVVGLDLASLDSVRRASDEIQTRYPRIDVLINNAGVAGMHGQTNEGFELTFGVNHVGHFLFTLRLRELLRAGASSEPARVVTVASRAHSRTNAFHWDRLEVPTKTRTGYPEYADSKLANVLFSARLAREWRDDGIHSYALHPGVVASDVWRHAPRPIAAIAKLFMLSNEEGAQTSLYCATDPGCAEESGLYYAESRPKEPSALARDPKLQDELWRRSLEWTGLA